MADGCNQILVAAQPTQSLEIALVVTKGYKQIRNTVGSYVSSYLASTAVATLATELSPAGTYTGGAGNVLVLKTSAQVAVTITKSDATTVSFLVNSLLVIDFPFNGFTVENEQDEGVANIQISTSKT